MYESPKRCKKDRDSEGSQTIDAYIPPRAEERDKGLGLPMGQRQFTGSQKRVFGAPRLHCQQMSLSGEKVAPITALSPAQAPFLM